MVERKTYKDLLWVDLLNPTPEETRALAEELLFPLDIGDRLIEPSEKSSIDIRDDFIFLILHFPASERSTGNATQEIDFLITKQYLVTARYDAVEPLAFFAKRFETFGAIENAPHTRHAGFIFYYMIREVYHALSHKLEHIDYEIVHIEEQVFRGRERAMVRKISETARATLDMKHILGRQHDILRTLAGEGARTLGEEFTHELDEILAHYQHITRSVDNQREFLEDLRRTNDSLLSAKQNEIMKIFTILAFVTLPLSLVAGLFGMNIENPPIVGHPNDFWIIIGIMAGLTVLMFAFFKYKKWL